MRAGDRSRTACQWRRLVWRRRRAGAEQAPPSVKSLEEIEMPNSAPGFVSRPDYRIDLLPESRRVKVVFGGETVADSGAALRVEETGHGPVYYLPEKDVRLDLMHPTQHHTPRPHKGDASYSAIGPPRAQRPQRPAVVP